jgi:uncharacterized protein YdiU (UPF0061 family)
MTSPFAFDNSYVRLPERFYARVQPTPVTSATLIGLNRPLALELGLDPDILAGPLGAEVFSGNTVPAGAEPLAMAYAGHQFGHFVRQLGDGRAILLGEVLDRQGVRRDIQLKGSGRTPFSRQGDGRAALGPVLREYLVSEAMAALGVPTTRTLAAVTTGESVMRETPLPGAVLTRVATSHLRVGTFQFFAARGDLEGVRQLADYAIERHFPDLSGKVHRYRAFLEAVIGRHAALVAQWLSIGFIHGVMNTDNTSIVGETIDYGPCAFIDAYDPAAVFSYIDQGGRYAYAQQPRIAQWNLSRLAEALLPLLDDDEATALAGAKDAIGAFPDLYAAAYLAGFRRKLGLSTEDPADGQLIDDLLSAMARHEADFTLTFRGLCDAAAGPAGDEAVRRLFDQPADYDAWAVGWRHRLAAEGRDPTALRVDMQRVNPAVIPRNHRIEAVIRAAVATGDLAPFNELLGVLGDPYGNRPESRPYSLPPLPEERVLQTFCGT